MFRRGLLLLTSPISIVEPNIPRVLSAAVEHVRDILYVYFIPTATPTEQTSTPPPPYLKPTSQIDSLVTKIYSHAASHHQNLDVRVIVGNIGAPPVGPRPAVVNYDPQCSYDVVLADTDHTDKALSSYTMKYFSKERTPLQVKPLGIDLRPGAADGADGSKESQILQSYNEICMGGTFDRLHTGHKILLSHSAMICTRRLLVGVTDGKMNDSKGLPELIEPCDVRIRAVQDFLETVKPQIVHEVVPILDPFGPSIVDPAFQCIVVSEETKRGGESVNKRRKEQGISTLAIDVISLVEDEHHQQGEEDKISSSSLRRRLLGTLLKEPKSTRIASQPYVLGLTGGIASGKSSVCKRLQGLGAGVVDCDKLGHQAYEKDAPAYPKVIAAFGEDILSPDGSINRKALGPKVFGNSAALAKLNNIVWPVIRQFAQEEISNLHQKGHSVVVLDAAVLLEAGWDDLTHEVWTTFVPKDEAVKRIVERNQMSEEAASQRIGSQISNMERVSRADVVLCTLWEYDITQKQVEKAWGLLQQRIQQTNSLL